MTLNADALTLSLLAVLAALVIGFAARSVAARGRMRKRDRSRAAVRGAIGEYFRRSGVKVQVDCVLSEQGCYTALVESEPMKRFRLSHIIEMTLREHVRKSTGVDLDKIFWRFPIREAVQAQAAQAAPAAAGTPAQAAPVSSGAASASAAAAAPATVVTQEQSDEYINEGLEHYRHIPKPEVDEVPWEAFEEAAISQKQKASGQP